MERHESLLRRARARGGYVYGPGGIKVKIVRHEFPYDIGIFSNIAQGMGSRNVSHSNASYVCIGRLTCLLASGLVLASCCLPNYRERLRVRRE